MRFSLRNGIVLVGFLTLSGFLSCSSSKEKEDFSQTPAEQLFARAEKELKDDNVMHAIELFNELKTKYPYSSFAKTSELKIADAYFQQESYAEAAASYQGFIQLYPKDERVDYATFRKGLCHAQQSPDVVARDLTRAHDAIAAFEELMQKYPQSKYFKEAENAKITMLKKLAEKENYIGNFYFIRDHFLSASIRYDRILKDYRGLGLDEIALFRSGVSYEKIQQPDKARERLTELIQNYPNHPLSREAKERLGSLE